MFTTSQTQNDLIRTMNTLQNEMSMYLSLIEQEKMKYPPNLNLIQFYINCHAQKMQEFKILIPNLPSISNKYGEGSHDKNYTDNLQFWVDF